MKPIINMSNVPDEVLINIIAHTNPTPIDLVHLRQVNHQWLEAATADRLWYRYSPRLISGERPLAEAFVNRRNRGSLLHNEQLRAIYAEPLGRATGLLNSLDKTRTEDHFAAVLSKMTTDDWLLCKKFNKIPHAILDDAAIMRPLIDKHPQLLLYVPNKIVKRIDIEKMLRVQGHLIRLLPPRYRKDEELIRIATPSVVNSYQDLPLIDRSSPLLAQIFLSESLSKNWSVVPMRAFEMSDHWDDSFLEDLCSRPGPKTIPELMPRNYPISRSLKLAMWANFFRDIPYALELFDSKSLYAELNVSAFETLSDESFRRDLKFRLKPLDDLYIRGYLQKVARH